ncbi:hypothetical protein GZ78_12305 [Endozoicomonas numazuensis]|uniref:Uncharacterized protein n=1 Tax=Endozoicomonas numazuensis TaxID=1137799 RepID=A0A081NIM3_9GAMM|nr:hypothetical protein GZ78_12305 [Endozoicomonas numazuensis]
MVTILGAGIYLYPSLLWIVFFFITYILHETLFADHIYYRRCCDYKWKVSDKDCQKAIFDGPVLLLPETLRSEEFSVFLKIKVRARLSGKLFDPALRILSVAQRHVQFF